MVVFLNIYLVIRALRISWIKYWIISGEFLNFNGVFANSTNMGRLAQLPICSRRCLDLPCENSIVELERRERERETEISSPHQRGWCERGRDEARRAVSDVGDRIGGIISLNLENCENPLWIRCAGGSARACTGQLTMGKLDFAG